MGGETRTGLPLDSQHRPSDSLTERDSLFIQSRYRRMGGFGRAAFHTLPQGGRR